MMLCLALFLIIFVLNLIFYKLVWDVNKRYNQILKFEKDFFYLTFKEAHKLERSGFHVLKKSYDKLMKTSYLPELNRAKWLVGKRIALLKEYDSLKKKTVRLLEKISHDLNELYLDVRYIHKHHIIYFKNFLADTPRQNNEYAEIDQATFEKSAVKEAPQPDIIGCAVEIQNGLYQLMDIFYKLRLGNNISRLIDRFPNVMKGFYENVDKFEKFSLDAQDGLLVEELLRLGRLYEKSFNKLLEYKKKEKDLEFRLSLNRDAIFDAVKNKENALRQKYDSFSNYMFLLQFISIFVATSLVVWLVLNSQEIIRQIQKAIKETRKIQMDPSVSIKVPEKALGEFKVLYDTLNQMGSTIYGQLKKLNDEIRHRQNIEIELRKLFFAIEQSPNGVMIVDRDMRIQYVNPQFSEMTGYARKEIVGKGLNIIKEIFVGTSYFSGEYIRAGGILTDDIRIKKKDGREYEAHISISPIRDVDGKIINFLCIVQDVSQKKKLEEELRRRERLESIGILAGGIAHDFNNILTAISGNLSLAQFYCEPGSKLAEKLENAVKACQQAKALTWQLLTFSKGGTPIKKTSSLSDIVKETAQFVLAGSNVKIEFEIEKGLWPVEVDKGQISQVINNLIINADQAMPEGGVIWLRLKNVEIYEDSSLPLSPGKYVLLEIEDQGVGIPESHLEKIFDPYFTTKTKGSGLGLAISYSIIKQHDGCITVSSKPGIGTRFDVYLPASVKEISDQMSVETNQSIAPLKVLFMDDEATVREVAKEMLKVLGHDVTVVKDGAELLERYESAMKQGSPFDLVIMDLTIRGGMGGKEAIIRLRQIDADVKAIVASGYSNDPVMSRFMEYGFSGVVRKPFRLSELRKAIISVFLK